MGWENFLIFQIILRQTKKLGAVAGATSGTGAKYPFKVAITSEVGDLKQGFTVNIEVVNTSKNVLVPVTAVVYEEDKTFVWTIVDGKAKKVEVTLGNADAINQEVQNRIGSWRLCHFIPNIGLRRWKRGRSL